MVIDDAQWLDPESGTVFGFAARRLDAEAVVMLFVVREAVTAHPGCRAYPSWPSIAWVTVTPASLLRDVIGGPLNPREVEAQLLRERGGNQLALVEMGG